MMHYAKTTNNYMLFTLVFVFRTRTECDDCPVNVVLVVAEGNYLARLLKMKSNTNGAYLDPYLRRTPFKALIILNKIRELIVLSSPGFAGSTQATC